MAKWNKNMKIAALLLMLSGCASVKFPQPHFYDCQVLPYALSIHIERYNMGEAQQDALTIAKRLNLKDYEIACRQVEEF